MSTITGVLINADTGQVSYSADSVSEIQFNHIDGPVLHHKSGQMTWLSWWDRFQLHFGMITIADLEKKYYPEFP
jgi:hypothetical protein